MGRSLNDPVGFRVSSSSQSEFTPIVFASRFAATRGTPPSPSETICFGSSIGSNSRNLHTPFCRRERTSLLRTSRIDSMSYEMSSLPSSRFGHLIKRELGSYSVPQREHFILATNDFIFTTLVGAETRLFDYVPARLVLIEFLYRITIKCVLPFWDLNILAFTT